MKIARQIGIALLMVVTLAGFVPAVGIPSATAAVASFSVQVVYATNTQAVLSYAAPDNNACSIKVSENASLSPLVHDVDPALFAGSDSDARSGAISAGTHRIFVVGTRNADIGADGVNYSRALQENTAHYYQVACGSSVATGSFTTAVTALGDTYRDIPYANPNHPGAIIVPTINDDITQTVVDPHTGVLMKKVSNNAEFTGAANSFLFLYYGGHINMCATQKSGPDSSGYLCAFPSGDGGAGRLFYITSGGQSTYLGYISPDRRSGPDGWPFMLSIGAPQITDDGSIYAAIGGNSGLILVKGTYAGNYQGVIGNTVATMNWQNITPSPNDLMSQLQAFDPNFNPSNYQLGVSSVSGNYYVFAMIRNAQDSPGWYAVVDLTIGKVIAAMNIEGGPNQAISYCGSHNVAEMSGTNIVGPAFHGLWGGGGPVAWQGPYTTTLVNAIDQTASTIQISGSPTEWDGKTLGGPWVGSILAVGSEPVKVTSVVATSTGGITLQVQRNYMPVLEPWDDGSTHHSVNHSAGESVVAECTDWSYGFDVPMYWNFMNDPHAQHLGTDVVYGNGLFTGHTDFGKNVMMVEGWNIRTGPLAQQLTRPITYNLSVDPYFANAAGGCDSSTCAQHPNYSVEGAQWFTDGLPWDGGYIAYPNAIQQISGQLYKYAYPYNDGNWLLPERSLHRKQVPTIATTGGTILVDVSGPSSLLSDQPSDSYKYCITYKDGECRPGSHAGDIFANVPGALDKTTCYGADHPYPSVKDLCFTDMPMFASAMVQAGFVPNHEGIGILPGQPDTAGAGTLGAGYSRIVTEGLGGLKHTGEEFKAMPDGSWGFFGGGGYMMMAKMPPFTKDSLRRDTFMRAPLTITPPSGQGITGATVEFGYAENGSAAAYHCTSRNEACVTASSVVDDTNPFSYEQADPWTPVPCNASCIVTLPVIPEHVAYYQVKYFNAAGALVALGDKGVAAEGTIADINNLSVPPAATVSFLTPTSGAIVSSTILLTALFTGNGGSVSYQVDNGLSSPTIFLAPYAMNLDTTLFPNGLHQLTVTAQGLSGNLSSSTIQVTIQNNATPAPHITTNPTISNVSSQAATISWTTDTPADSLVNYGTTTAYGSVKSSASQIVSHSILLSGLLPKTLCHFTVVSQNSGGSVSSTDAQFSTIDVSASTSTPPLQITSQVNISAQDTAASLSWATNNPASTRADYGTPLPYALSFQDGSLVTLHTATLVSLSPGTTYHVQVQSTDAALSSTSSPDIIFQTTGSAGGSPSGGGGGGGGGLPPTIIPLRLITTSTPIQAPLSPFSAPKSSSPASSPLIPLTSKLSPGSSDKSQVVSLQNFLAMKGYLNASGVNGSFGAATIAALQKYQCDTGIVCRGTPASTGWGSAGPKTLAAINSDIQMLNSASAAPLLSSAEALSLLKKPLKSLTLTELKNLLAYLIDQVKILQVKLAAAKAAGR